MMRGRTPRHARPSGRGALAAAYDDLRAELVSVRSAHWTDQLELVRLTALTEELTGQVGSLQDELASVRAALELSRATPPLVIREPYPVYPPAAQPYASPAYQAQPYAPQPYAGQAYPAPPAAAPAAAPAPAPQAAAVAGVREDLLLAEMAELRRLVAHQQQLLADLTVRLLDLLARFIPAAPAAAPQQPTAAAPAPYPGSAAAPPAAAPAQAPQPAQPPAGAPVAPMFAPAPVPQPPSDLVLDDETATRLRVIREAFGR